MLWWCSWGTSPGDFSLWLFLVICTLLFSWELLQSTAQKAPSPHPLDPLHHVVQPGRPPVLAEVLVALHADQQQRLSDVRGLLSPWHPVAAACVLDLHGEALLQ